MNRVLTMLPAIGLVAAVAAQAQTGGFVGQWHWNRGASSTNPGEPAPKDVVLNIAAADSSRVQSTITITDDQGQKHVEQFGGVPDGKPRPLPAPAGAPAGQGAGATIAFTLANNTMKTVVHSPDGGSDTQSCTVSPDQRQLTCNGTENDGKGHNQNYRDVYDRM